MLQCGEERHQANRVLYVLTKRKIFRMFLPQRQKVGTEPVTVLQWLRRSKPYTPKVYSVAFLGWSLADVRYFSSLLLDLVLVADYKKVNHIDGTCPQTTYSF